MSKAGIKGRRYDAWQGLRKAQCALQYESDTVAVAATMDVFAPSGFNALHTKEWSKQCKIPFVLLACPENTETEQQR